MSKMHEALHVSLPKPDDVAKNALGRHGNFIKDFAHALDHATVLLEPFVTKERYATLRMEKCGIEGVRFFDAWSKDFMPPLSRKKRIFCARSVLTVVCGLCLLSRLISILLDSASQLPRLRCECEAWVHFEHLLNSSDPSDIVDDHGVTFQGGRLLDRFELMWLGCHDEPWARPMFGASQSIDRTLIVNHTHVRIEVIGCEAQFDQMFIVGGNWVRILPMIVATISMLVCVPFVLYKNVSKAIAKELPLHAPTVVFAVLQARLPCPVRSICSVPIGCSRAATCRSSCAW